jgi:chromatin remodeling complex protein RSC6
MGIKDNQQTYFRKSNFDQKVSLSKAIAQMLMKPIATNGV